MKLLGVQRRYVPHFKGLISGKVELEAQGRDSTFTFHHALLKKAILLLKMVKSPVFLQGAVLDLSNFKFPSRLALAMPLDNVEIRGAYQWTHVLKVLAHAVCVSKPSHVCWVIEFLDQVFKIIEILA